MLTVRIFAAFTRKLFPQNGTAKALWNLLCIQNKIALTDAAPLQFSHEWIAQIVLCTVAVCLAFTQKNATHETLSQLSWCERTTPALRVTGAWQAPNSEAYCRGRQSLLDALALQFSRIPQHKLKWQHMQWMWEAVNSQGYCKTQKNQHSWFHALTLEGVTTTPQTCLHTVSEIDFTQSVNWQTISTDTTTTKSRLTVGETLKFRWQVSLFTNRSPQPSCVPSSALLLRVSVWTQINAHAYRNVNIQIYIYISTHIYI